MNNKTSFPASLCVLYSLPVITTTWLLTPIAIVQGIYAKYYGISLTSMAALIFVTRLFDAVTDPLIGYYADCYYNRTGSHKPFILAGGLLFIVSSYFLYVPPEQVGNAYLLIWLLAIYLAWTLFEIPHLAWANSLALTSTDKTLIFSYRTVAGYIGMLLFYSIPLLPIFETRDITPDTLKVSVIIADLLMLVFLFYGLKATPGKFYGSVCCRNKGPNTTKQKSDSLHEQQGEFWKTLNFIIKNKPFLLFISAYLLLTSGSGMWYGLIFIYVDGYLKMGAQFAQVFILAFAMGILFVPIWYRAALSLGKKCSFMISILLLCISFIYTAVLTPLNSGFNQLALLNIIQSIAVSGLASIAPAMLAEIADYGIWKTGTDRTNTCFSVFTFTYKASNALGAAFALGLAGWFGFDMTAATHDAKSIWGLSLAMTWVPIALGSFALVFVALGPMSTHRHRIIRKALDRRAKRKIV